MKATVIYPYDYVEVLFSFNRRCLKHLSIFNVVLLFFDCVAHHASGLFWHRVRYLVYLTKRRVVYAIRLVYIDDTCEFILPAQTFWSLLSNWL